MKKTLIYDSVLDLYKTEYFDLKNNKLYIKKDLFNKAIDFHTHIAWSYLFCRKIDLNKKSKTKHFFPEDKNPVNLNQYSALDFTPESKKKSTKETLKALWNRRGYSSTHTIPNLKEEMKRLNIKKSIVLAVELIIRSRNSQRVLTALKNDRKLLPFASLHPNYKNKEKKIIQFLKMGTMGIKLHPPLQMSRPTKKGYYEIYELCKKYKLPILFHCGYSPLSPKFEIKYTNPTDFEKVVNDFPDITFIMGHAGCTDITEEISNTAKKHENVYLELSGQPPEVIKMFIKKLGTDRLMYGSDWPYYPMALPLVKVLIATEKLPQTREKILYQNADNLIKRLSKNIIRNI